MNFTLDETQIAIRDLARRVFTEHERHKELEAAGQTFDAELWDALRTTGLTDVDGFVDQCIVLIEQGRTVAPVPLWTRYATRRDATLAIDGVAPDADVFPEVMFVQDGAVFGAPPVILERRRTTAGAEFVVDTSAGTKLDIDPSDLLDRAVVLRCALGVGIAERALEMTAAYVSERKQFDKPLGSFQAVQQRAADAYIDVEAMRLTMLQAAWQIDEGRDAGNAVEIARFWASEAGQRVVGTAQHLHGGMGADIDYPLFRYTIAMKEIELAFGGATETLARMGAML
jgi:alkylation response protein AidB-like acyl-CoA dehydrogenase